MRDKLNLIAAMVVVGTIGIFVTYIPLPSSVIAFVRAVTGSLFLVIVMVAKKEKISWKTVKENGILLLLSGTALGFNWVFLFEAYHYTTVSVATLCYYMAPVFVILLSPLILKEKLTRVSVLCTVAAVVGAVLISGVAGSGGQDIRGIGFGLLAAFLYCSILLLNKKMKGLKDLEKTFFQLAISAVVMFIYVLSTQKLNTLQVTSRTLALLLIIGIVHTGIIYILFFSAIGRLPAQTSSILSYLDPVTAILMSMIILHQPLTLIQICGTILILGSTFANERLGLRKEKSVYDIVEREGVNDKEDQNR